MSAEVVQQILAAFNGLVHVEACYGSCRACGHIVGPGQDDSRAEVDFRQARSHDTDYALVPLLVVDDDGLVLVLVVQFRHNLIGLLGHCLVQVLSLLVELVDLCCLVSCGFVVALYE